MVKKKKDDFRRGPYNLWVIMVGILIFLVVSGTGVVLGYVGLQEQEINGCEIEYEVSGYFLWVSHRYNFTEFVDGIYLECTENFEEYVCLDDGWCFDKIINSNCNLENVTVNKDSLEEPKCVINKEQTISDGIRDYTVRVFAIILFGLGMYLSGAWLENRYWKKGKGKK